MEKQQRMRVFIAGRPIKTWPGAHDACRGVYRLMVGKQTQGPGDPANHPRSDPPEQKPGRPARSQQSPGSPFSGEE